ncbi:MAG: stage II sporulation protein P [Ruminococcus sp.]|nr:stage II sporulation protein P [Ruminococcus sp.]
MRSGKLKKTCSFIISFVLVSLAIACVTVRVPHFINNDKAALMAAALTVSKGSYSAETTEQPTQKATEKETAPARDTTPTEPATSAFSSNYYNTFDEHKNAEKLPVYTKQYAEGGDKYENFYVKNNTWFDLNIGAELKSRLGFDFENTSDVQVLIYHTHTSESYLDCDVGYYYSDFYPRTSDTRYNVTRVGEAIAESLRKEGIGVVHDTTSHDDTYNGSYDRSYQTVQNYLKKYPKIKVTLDIHRDSIGSDEYKVKPTFSYKGKKGAQIMIMSGYDPDGEYGFPDWEYNLRFALRLQKSCEDNYRGMTRPVDFGEFVYNMNVNTGSLLIEVGTEANTLSEAEYSGKLLGKALAKVLQKAT